MSKKNKKKKPIKPQMSRKAAIKLIRKQQSTYGESTPFEFLSGKDDQGNVQFDIYDTDQYCAVVSAHPTPETQGYLDMVFRHLYKEMSIQHYMRRGYHKDD